MTPAKAPLPFLGTWKLTHCKSSHPDLPHPVSGTTIFSEAANCIHYRNDSVWTDGQAATVNFVFHIDGNWYPITGSRLADSLSFRSLEDSSIQATMKKGGVEVGTNHTTVSADGQTLTSHWKFAGPGGTSITWETTSQRQ
jgi:hypothetical protein